MRLQRYGFVAILLLTILVRMYGAWRFPFEQDELYTVDEATNLFHTRLLPGIQARPVFFVLEHPIAKWLPHTPLILRALPLIFGILGVWVTYLFARRALGASAGLAAAFFAAISPWHVQASGFARYYSFLYVLAALAYWLVPTAVDRDRRDGYLAALLVLLVGAWTHPSFVFPVAAAIVGALMIGPDGRVTWRWPSRTAWLYLWGPFLLVSLSGVAAIKLLRPTAGVANGGDRGLAATLRLVPAMVDWITPVLFTAACIGAVVLLRSGVPAWRRLGVMVLLGVSGMLVALFALAFRTAIYADYGISALPLVFVAAAALVTWGGGDRPARVLAVAAVVTVGMLPSLASHLSDGTRFDYRPAFARVVREAPGATVLAWPIVLQRWYAPSLNGVELRPGVPRLDSILRHDREVWAVTSVKRYGLVGDDTGELTAWLAGHCRPVDQYQRPRLDYRMYRVDLWRCAAGS